MLKKLNELMGWQAVVNFCSDSKIKLRAVHYSIELDFFFSNFFFQLLKKLYKPFGALKKSI